ncbi:MAG: Slp family lipoprotein [Thiohalorhabdus sp.]|uniref:Slp family lipoprotein n=1 Tax=Thiohalorhabdus sp. TaxID=3094134 RepID=UPI00397F3567
MRTLGRGLFATLWILALVACAGTPRFSVDEGVAEVSPREAKRDMASLEGSRVLWGGVIVNTTNLEDRTRLEILAYPLDGRQKPDVEADPRGRFLAEAEGYLETADYAPGRRVTVSGTLEETRKGRIGEAEYTYPVVEVADQELWTEDRRAPEGPRFHFGIGVIFGG